MRFIINMNTKVWNEKIKINFNNSASHYLDNSIIQNYFAKKIVSLLKTLNIPEGEWLDLGSGTGFLADEIEKVFTKQNVYRFDFSKNMLLMNKSSSKKKLWDLNNDLPLSIDTSSIIVSNFCLQWLNNPEKTIRDWFKKLKVGGFLVISYPTNNSFPEWKETCKNIQIEYSGLEFPDSKKLLKLFKPDEIYLANEYEYIENFPDIFKLFRNIINIGAQSTKSQRKTISELKKMQKFWPKNKNNSVNLTWEISIQILKKL